MVKPSSKHKVKDEPHLSGAYIRTLVKHLSTSVKTKDHKLPESANSNTMQDSPPPPPPPLAPPPPPPPHKKQVRRRQHTTKPYQQRLLNMAEARREIVTALKFHRAAMKQRETTAGDGDHPTQPEQSTGAYTSSTSTVSDAAATTAADLSNSYLEQYYPSLSCSDPYFFPMSTTSPPPLPPLNQENLDNDFTLPNQTLGLNLNFRDFQNMDTNLYYNPLSNYATSSSSSSSSSSSVSAGVGEELVAVATSSATATTTTTAAASSSSCSGDTINGGLHHAMDDEGMEEIRSLGEQHQIEWNDKLNLLMSARWFKFLETINGSEEEDGKFDDEVNPFDRVLEFPPCMDIGESERMDEEWLA